MLSTRLSQITPSVTIGINSRVNELINQGHNIINLSIGEPDFNVPHEAKNYGINSLNTNITKYDLVQGVKVLREEISKKLLIENKCKYSIDEIVVSNGAKHAITNTILAITDPGDEILLPKPYWVSYSEITKILNCKPIIIETKKDNNFKLTADLLKQYITPKTKLLILTNPSNPTGAIYTKEELLDIANVCLENNIYILSDEIYERLCYSDNFTSTASLSEDIKNITITINGFSKSCAMTGIRLGYTASNKDIAKAITSIQGHLVSHPSLTAQYIGYGALKDCSNDINSMVNTYKHRRDLITQLLDSMDNLSYIYPEGAFYIFIDISKIKNNLNYKESLSVEFCEQLLNKYNVAVVPGVAFGIDDYIRISYACNENDVIEGLNRLNDFVTELLDNNTKFYL